MIATDETIFDLLEEIAEALDEKNRPLSLRLRSSFARGTKGVEPYMAARILLDNLPSTSNRARAFQLIDGEREYQNIVWSQDNDSGHAPTAWLVFIQHYLTKAMAAAAQAEPREEVMENIRKIGAMCVAAMEEIETPERKI